MANERFEKWWGSNPESWNDAKSLAQLAWNAALSAAEPTCEHEWKLKSGRLDSGGEHYIDACTKCHATRVRHEPLP